jgi:hypothetical protein
MTVSTATDSLNFPPAGNTISLDILGPHSAKDHPRCVRWWLTVTLEV